MSLCLLCETRKPKRYCPASRGDICPQCCGTEREVTVDCPLDCGYLLEARRHEKVQPMSPDNVPHPDIKISDGFLQRNDQLVQVAGLFLTQSAMETQGAVDADIREAIEAMIKTLRTAESGLIYETRPANPYAESIRQRFGAHIEQLKEQAYRETGVHLVRDTDVLGVLVFYARLAAMYSNGRRRGRAYLTMLLGSSASMIEQREKAGGGSSLVTP
jgi:hypothetical protein